MDKAKTFGELGIWQILTYSTGYWTILLPAGILIYLVLPIYSIALGVDAALVGTLLALTRLWDAVTDPVMGIVTDNTRTRWGRRRPYLFAGAILSATFFAMIWFVPVSLTSFGKACYLFFMLILMYTGTTIFLVPYIALGNEISYNSDVRARVIACRTALMAIPTLLFPWSYKLCFYLGRNEVEASRNMGLMIGLLMIVTGCLCAVFNKGNLATLRQEKLRFGESFKAAITNRSFLMLMGIYVFTLASIVVVTPIFMCLIIYYVCQGYRELGAKIIGIHGTIGAFIMFFLPVLIKFLNVKINNKGLLYLAMGLWLLGVAISWWVFNPNYPYACLITSFFISVLYPISCLVSYLILADICDDDSVKNKTKREGIYSSMFGFIEKASFTIAIAAGSWMVTLSGIRPGTDAIQTPEALVKLKILFATTSLPAILMALILTVLYPIVKKNLLEPVA